MVGREATDPPALCADLDLSWWLFLVPSQLPLTYLAFSCLSEMLLFYLAL